MEQKQKVVVAAGLGVSAVVLLATGALLFLQLTSMWEKADERQNRVEELRDSYATKPYPSDENIAVRKQDMKDMESWNASVLEQIRAGASVLHLTEGESAQQFNSRITDGMKAFQAKQQWRVLPLDQRRQQKEGEDSNADLGFKALIDSGTPPPNDQLPRLSLQYGIISHLCTLFFDSGVVVIENITRDDVKTEDAPVAQPTTSRRGRRGRTETPAASVATSIGSAVPEVLASQVKKESFRITFRARYSALAKVLNDLASDPLFVVVTDVQVEQPASVKMSYDEIMKKRETKTTRKRGDAADEAAAPKNPLENTKRYERRVTQEPKESTPLKVVLALDVFLPVESAKEGE